MLTHKDLETFSEALGFGKDQAAITQAMLNVACPASHVLLWIGNPPSIPEPYLSAIKGYLGDAAAAEETEEPEAPPPVPVTEPVNDSTANEGEVEGEGEPSTEGEAADEGEGEAADEGEGEGDDEAEADIEDNQDSEPVTDEDEDEDEDNV